MTMCSDCQLSKCFQRVHLCACCTRHSILMLCLVHLAPVNTHTGLSFLSLPFPPSLMCTEVDTEGTVPPDDDPPQDMGDPDKEVGSCT